MLLAGRHVVTQILASIIATAVGFDAFVGGDPEKDPQTMKLLQDARSLIDNKNSTAAIAKCEEVINAYKAHYGSSSRRFFAHVRRKRVYS